MYKGTITALQNTLKSFRYSSFTPHARVSQPTYGGSWLEEGYNVTPDTTLHIKEFCNTKATRRKHNEMNNVLLGGDTPHQIHGICARAVLDRNTCQGTTGLALAGHLDYGI